MFSTSSSITSGGSLTTDEALLSSNGALYTVMQGDSNLVTYFAVYGVGMSGPNNEGNPSVWSTETGGQGTNPELTLDGYGHLKLTSSEGFLWDNNYNGPEDTYTLFLDDSGVLQVSNSAGDSVWSGGESQGTWEIQNGSITNLVYDLDSAVIGLPQSVVLDQTEIVNGSDQPLTVAATLTGSVSEAHQWNVSVALSSTVTVTIEAGIPFLAEGKVNVGITETITGGYQSTYTTTETEACQATVTVAPGDSLTLSIAQQMSNVSMSFLATATIVYEQASPEVTVFTTNFSGSYTGALGGNTQVGTLSPPS